MSNLFNKTITNTYISKYSVDNLDEKISIIKCWKNQLSTIKELNEKELQSDFLKGIFGNILGYKGVTEVNNEWNISIETSTEVDASTPDAILGFYTKENASTQVVIELKGPGINLDKEQKRLGKNYGTPIEQAFSYTSKYDKCKWVIVSNMLEIRLYKVGRSQEYYEKFMLIELDNPNMLKKFHRLLAKENLIHKVGKSFTLELSEKSESHVKRITLEFYNIFNSLRIDLFEHLKKHNLYYDEKILVEKSQKFLDRIIFIAFCENVGLLPYNLLHKAIEKGKHSYNIDDITIWSEIKGVFKSIDKGNSDHNINAYNGGLFKDDEVLDNLIIKNHFFDLIDEITTYDFDTDLDVNILGHIFEQSISDIDNLKISLQKGEYNSEKSKKQKLGIYYTPQYITKLILENSLGKYLESIRMRLGENDLPDINSATTPQIKGKYKKKHIEFYNNYINELKKLKILDPACGSGAFLNQTFDYLCEQFDWAYTQKESIIRNKKVVGYRLKLDHIENDILMNNLYGVDINEESIEITRLSLWLKTANKSKRLANLDNNIKCGNSLICDSDVGGEKAFIWKKEFPAIMNDDGFDIIIGNPPYGFDFNSKEKSILKRQYPDVPDYESAYFFLEKCYKLLKQNGFLSFIIPNMFMSNIYAKSFRIKLLNDFNLEKIINLSNKDIFIDANVRTCIVVISRKKRNPNDSVFLVNGDKIIRTNKSILLENIDNWLTLFSQKKEIETIINKIRQENCVQLYDVCEITQGLIPYDRYRGHSKETIKNRIWHSEYRKDDTYKKELKGGDVDRYFLNWNGKRWISYGEWLAAPREPKFFKGERILIREITDPYILATYTDKEYYNNPSIINVIRFKNINPFYLLGIINSKLITFFHYHTSPKAKKGLFPKILVDDVRKLYIKKEKEVTQEQLANMVKYILKTKKTCNNFKKIKFIEFSKKYTSTNECYLNSIVNNTFVNKIYSGTATKVRNFTVNINYNIIGLYTDKSGSGKYQILKFEENDKYKRKYIKLYLEHMTQEQLDQINCTQNGNLMEKVLSINIPDYNKRKVVKKVVEEWERLQQRLKELEDNIEKIQYDIDQMVYNLYGLNNNEINIVEDSL